MNYKLVEINKENQAILVDVDGWSIWIDYWKENEEEGYLWDFNQYIFYNWKGYMLTRDKKTMQAQEKIKEDIENFDCFMDSIFYDYADKL